MSDYANRKKTRFSIVFEDQQDLLAVPGDVTIAHCVAEDFRMTRGNASIFRKKFRRLDELQEQEPRVGKVLRLEDGTRSLFYLVTKKSSVERATFENIWHTLIELKKAACHYDIKKLALPKIGHALEKLDWKIVRSMSEVIF